jgi:uncharacterized protein (TIGR00266 family)
MAFCTNCGGQLSDAARFCTGCGSATGSTAAPPPQATTVAPTYSAPVSHEPLDYSIQGDNLQIIRIRLKPGQEIYAEAGKMLYKQPQVSWETRMTGSTFGEKLFGAVKRKLMGESLFLTYFRSNGPGEVGFAASYPGRIQAFDLAAGQSVLVQRDSFLVAQSSAQLNIAMVRKLGTGFFGGEGFILEKLTGPGTVFIHGGGDFVEFTLAANEMLQVDTGCLVAFDESVDYDVQLAGGIRTALFGGEGLFLATLRGPGRVIVQSMTLSKLRNELAPRFSNTSGEAHGLGAISQIFGSDD